MPEAGARCSLMRYSPSHCGQPRWRMRTSTTAAEATGIGRSSEPPTDSAASFSRSRTSRRIARARSRCSVRLRRITRLSHSTPGSAAAGGCSVLLRAAMLLCCCDMTVDPSARTEAGPGGEAAPVLGPGALIGKYRLDRELGAGGMGVVWAAYDPDLERPVAIKLLRSVDSA